MKINYRVSIADNHKFISIHNKGYIKYREATFLKYILKFKNYYI